VTWLEPNAEVHDQGAYVTWYVCEV